MMARFMTCVGIKSSAIDLKRIKSYEILFMGFKRNSIKIKKTSLRGSYYATCEFKGNYLVTYFCINDK